MKKMLITIAIVSLIAPGVFAQGQFDFSNAGPGLNAPITNAAGVLLPTGSAYTVDLYWNTTATPGANGLLANDLGLAVNPSAAPGYFFGGIRAIPGQTGTVYVQVAAYNTSGGSFANATERGFSNIIPINLASVPQVPTFMYGLQGYILQGFGMTVVPEPTTVAFVSLGAVTLLLSRRLRRK